MPKLTDDRIRELRELCEAATPGPWVSGWGNGVTGPTTVPLTHFDLVDCGMVSRVLPGLGGGTTPENYCSEVVARTPLERLADQDFIAAARTALPAALKEVVRLRGALKEHKHTDACLEYATQTGKPFCIAECADSWRTALGKEN